MAALAIALLLVPALMQTINLRHQLHTGHGEPFICAVAAYDVSCLMEYKGLSLQDAMNEVVMKKLIAMDGEGGMIGTDAHGNTAMVFNSAGMYRGMKNSAGENHIRYL